MSADKLFESRVTTDALILMAAERDQAIRERDNYLRANSTLLDDVKRLVAELAAERAAREKAERERDSHRALLGNFDKRCADALADEVDAMVRRHVIDSRSPAADALLDYRNPPTTPRSDRLAVLDSQVAALTASHTQLQAEAAAMRGAITALASVAEKVSTRLTEHNCTVNPKLLDDKVADARRALASTAGQSLLAAHRRELEQRDARIKELERLRSSLMKPPSKVRRGDLFYYVCPHCLESILAGDGDIVHRRDCPHSISAALSAHDSSADGGGK